MVFPFRNQFNILFHNWVVYQLRFQRIHQFQLLRWLFLPKYIFNLCLLHHMIVNFSIIDLHLLRILILCGYLITCDILRNILIFWIDNSCISISSNDSFVIHKVFISLLVNPNIIPISTHILNIMACSILL